ncbi:ethanolamine permease [compost metagenome]
MTSPAITGGSGMLASVVGIGAVFGLIATFFSLIFAGSRQIFAMARDGLLPSVLAHTGPRGTPYWALLLVAAIGLPMSLVSPEKVMLAVVLLLNFCYLFIFAAFIRIRRTQPNLKRPFRLPGGTLVAALGFAMTLVVIAACFQLEVITLLAIGATLALLSLNFAIRSQLQSRPLSLEGTDHV